MRRNIWGECADGLWVCQRVHGPTDISGKVLCLQVGTSMGSNKIRCPLTVWCSAQHTTKNIKTGLGVAKL